MQVAARRAARVAHLADLLAGENAVAGAHQRSLAHVHVDVVDARARGVHHHVVAGGAVESRVLDLAAASERQLGAAAGEHVLPLVAAAPAEVVGLGLAEIVAAADREEVVGEEEAVGRRSGAGHAFDLEVIGPGGAHPAVALAVPLDLSRLSRRSLHIPRAHDLVGRLAQQLHAGGLLDREARPPPAGVEITRIRRQVERLGFGSVADADGESRGGAGPPAVDQLQTTRDGL